MEEAVVNLLELARLRRELEEAKRLKDESYAAWKKANEGLLQRVTALTEAVDELTEEVKKGAVELFEDTGDRDIVPGVQFRMTKVVKYDPDKAKKWAVSRGEVDLLKFDGRKFERLVKGIKTARARDVLGLSEVVEIAIEPKAALASNLEAALAKAGITLEDDGK